MWVDARSFSLWSVFVVLFIAAGHKNITNDVIFLFQVNGFKNIYYPLNINVLKWKTFMIIERAHRNN
jgi:hypothetical protein